MQQAQAEGANAAPSKKRDLRKEALAWLEAREDQMPMDFIPMVRKFLADADAERTASLIERAVGHRVNTQPQFSRTSAHQKGSDCFLPSALLPPE
jgi:hypothetical protein